MVGEMVIFAFSSIALQMVLFSGIEMIIGLLEELLTPMPLVGDTFGDRLIGGL